ncbi:MAG: response regulator [Candidatus Scalindua sp.]|nr:response regulator [Candidatus Scalindua sp.]MDV5166840.1 response regulator [Candidatus Scalindua sp.]
MMSNILIVDDSRNTCTLLKSFLEEMNHNVLVSYNENDALKKIMYLKKPDIIILDIVMNGIGGMELLKKNKDI